MTHLMVDSPFLIFCHQEVEYIHFHGRNIPGKQGAHNFNVLKALL